MERRISPPVGGGEHVEKDVGDDLILKEGRLIHNHQIHRVTPEQMVAAGEGDDPAPVGELDDGRVREGGGKEVNIIACE